MGLSGARSGGGADLREPDEGRAKRFRRGNWRVLGPLKTGLCENMRRLEIGIHRAKTCPEGLPWAGA